MTLDNLYQLIISRKKNMPQGSYVASLFANDEDRMIQKIGEEATELVIAAKNNSKTRLIEETADLFFHSLVLLASKNVQLEEIWQELNKRNKQTKLKN